MKRVVYGLDWDAGNREKCTKHGLSLDEIEEFFKMDIRIIADPKHSQIEDRHIAVGRASSGRPMLVGFTFRMKANKLFIRPISARYMHRKEADKYEKATS